MNESGPKALIYKLERKRQISRLNKALARLPWFPGVLPKPKPEPTANRKMK